MSRVFELFSWMLMVPYAYIAFFMGDMVGGSAKTPQIAAFVFWAYLAVYPVAAITCNLLTRATRAAGKRFWAVAFSLVPYPVLAVTIFLFPAFVKKVASL